MTPAVKRQIAAAKRNLPKQPAKPSKYRNVKTAVDGIAFASKREADRYEELKLMRRGGKIKCLETQIRFPLLVNGESCGVYIADFVYHDNRTGLTVCEDVKGVRTAVYRLKKKLMKACYGIDIVEV